MDRRNRRDARQAYTVISAGDPQIRQIPCTSRPVSVPALRRFARDGALGPFRSTDPQRVQTGRLGRVPRTSRVSGIFDAKEMPLAQRVHANHWCS